MQHAPVLPATQAMDVLVGRRGRTEGISFGADELAIRKTADLELRAIQWSPDSLIEKIRFSDFEVLRFDEANTMWVPDSHATTDWHEMRGTDITLTKRNPEISLQGRHHMPDDPHADVQRTIERERIETECHGRIRRRATRR